ncbi:hypothetical protein BD626DRAFT_513767, partial [Schizophyllum amplum]
MRQRIAVRRATFGRVRVCGIRRARYVRDFRQGLAYDARCGGGDGAVGLKVRGMFRSFEL